MSNAFDESQLNQLFIHARTHSKWLEKSVPDALLTQLYELLKLAPTSANCSPARFAFICSTDAKEKLKTALLQGNIEKTMTAPVTVIVAYDERFYDELPQLFPYADAKSWFNASPELAYETAFRNSSLQAAYLIMACRSLGLDVGPMSGFDKALLDQLFFADKTWKSNLLINIGYADSAKAHNRLPRLSFEEACVIE